MARSPKFSKPDFVSHKMEISEGPSEQVRRSRVSYHILGSPGSELWLKNLMLVLQDDSVAWTLISFFQLQVLWHENELQIHPIFVSVSSWSGSHGWCRRKIRSHRELPLCHLLMLHVRPRYVQNASPCEIREQIVVILENITAL